MSTFAKRAESHSLRRLRRTVRPVGIRATFIAVVAGILVVVMSTNASARWSTIGVGSGTAATGTLAAPTGTTASATPGSGTVNVSWTAPTTGVAPSGYKVSRVPTSGSPVSACGTGTTPVTTTSCSDTFVPDGTYTYVVTSVRGSWTAAGTASASVTVSAAIGTTTTVTSSANPSAVGQTVTYTATVTQASGTTKPTGTVTFKDGGSAISCTGGTQVLSSGTATCALSYPSVGAHSITAAYPGGGSFTGSTSPVITQSVSAASTTTALTSSVNPSVVGQTVTFTATVGAVSPGSGTPTGTVSFTNGGGAITCTGGTQALNSAGVATCQVAFGTTGTRTVAATYAGSTNYVTSTSANLSQAVNKANQTITFNQPATPANSGTTASLVATSTSGLQVAFTSATPAVCTVSGSTVSYVGGGTCTVNANQAGDADYNAASQVARSVTVNDVTAPVITMTYPTTGSQINNGHWGDNCPGAGICGTATDNVGVVGSVLYELRNTAPNPDTCWTGASFTAAACGSYRSTTGTLPLWFISMAWSSLPNSGTFEVRIKATDAAGNTNRVGANPPGSPSAADWAFSN